MKRLLVICYTLLYYIVTLCAQSDSIAHVTHFSEADGYAQSVVAYAIQDSHGYVWLCTWNGLVRYDGYRFETYKVHAGDGSPLRTNRIGSVRELPNGELECRTTDSMICVFHRKTARFEQVSGDYSQRPYPYLADAATTARVEALPAFHNSYFRILLTDRQGGIWVDTHSGLYRIWYSRKPLQPIKTTTATEQEVRGLYVDKQGRVWAGDKNGFLRIGNDYLSPHGKLSSQPVPFGMKVYCIYADSQGCIWLGCKPGGLVRLTQKNDGSYNVEHYTHHSDDPYSLSCDNIYAMAEDKNGRLWIATYKGGLNMLNLRAARNVFLHNKNGLLNWPTEKEADKIHCLYITPEQKLVVGTLNGLYTCALNKGPKQMHFYHNCRRPDDATSLSYNWVMDIEPIGRDTLAIATAGGGLCLISTKDLLTDNIRFQTYTTGSGLASEVCQSLLYDPQAQTLFVTSQASISSLSLKTHTFTNYLRGTLGDNFNLLETKPVRTIGGHYLFGTTHGLLDISPHDMQKSQFLPSIVFEHPDGIILSPDERSLTIKFSALDFNKLAPLTYAYRIDGMTSQWTYITDNSITLHDIPAGSYLLHLRSTNGDGVWMDNECTLKIQRRAAFLETPYAWMLFGLLLTLLGIGVFQVIRYIRRIQREIKDIRLTNLQRISVMSERIQELLSIHESVERIDATAENIENEEEQQFANHIKTYIEKNLSNSDLSVIDMACEMAVSRTVLFARMKSVFGTSPNNYLLGRRISQAKLLLRNPNASVTDVAYRCGFSEPKYFSKCFKKLVGLTPTEYQKGGAC